MEKGQDLKGCGSVTLRKSDDWIGDMVIPFYCTNCGFIELYTKKYIKKE